MSAIFILMKPSFDEGLDKCQLIFTSSSSALCVKYQLAACLRSVCYPFADNIFLI